MSTVICNQDLIQKERQKNRCTEELPHNEKSIELMQFLCEIDFNVYADYFGWKTGGSGDNGEILMYQLDAFFEEQTK